MTRTEYIKELLDEYARRRADEEIAQDRRVAEVCRRDPQIEYLRNRNATIALEGMRKMLGEQTKESARKIAEAVRDEGIRNNREMRERLKLLGLPEDYMEMHYRCEKCRDTGYVGEAPARFCECFLAALRLKQHEDGSMAGIGEQNFNRFDENFIPAEPVEGANYTQRELLVGARKLCENYADTFPATPKENILLMGAGGLGKTFLLNCIFARVIDRGQSAVRITAYRMFEAMRKQHVGNEPDYDGFTSLLETPLLLIDDLGTEPVMRNITIEYLFMLLNERMAARRHTVIATNLTPTQLKERYGERVASRLLDRSRCAAVMLKGRDLRTL